MLVTLNSPNVDVLSQKTVDFKIDEFAVEVQHVAEALLREIQPYIPCAGLAAPQIGINRSIFLYSWNRNPENLTFAINPTYIPIGDARQRGWEGCLSVINSKDCFELAQIPRYEKIKATYYNRTGQKEVRILESFAAKVFQHECDHLRGVINIHHPQAEVKAFPSKEALQDFVKQVKAKDTVNYIEPEIVKET